jgi:tetratricopeptide repeat protein 21B
VLEQALHDKSYLTSTASVSVSDPDHGRAAGGTDVDDMRQDVLTLLIIVQVKEASDYSHKEVSQALEWAVQCQKDIISALRSGGAARELVEAEKVRISELSQRLGAWLLQTDNEKSAEEALTSSLDSNPQNVEAMLTLANIYKARGKEDESAVELCRAQCRKVISSDPTNEAATIILSESIFTSEAPDDAVKPLQDLLTNSPNNYHALEKMIILLRRSGQLDQAPAFIKSADATDSRTASHTGLHFCKGLYARYTNDPIKAVIEFNQVRRDKEWGPDALVHMIELYLNPDNDGVWESEAKDGDGLIDESTAENISVAESLLVELEPKARDKRRLAVLQNYCSLATRQRIRIEHAMKSFITLLDDDIDYLPAVLGMATGFMVERNQNKARNLLRRVGSLEQKSTDGEDFEKANLLLAKFYTDKGTKP